MARRPGFPGRAQARRSRNCPPTAAGRSCRRPDLGRDGRVTGTIVEQKRPTSLLVDEGPAKGRRIVLIGPGAAGRIQVRFPKLEPGYLIDVIGLKHDGYLQALIPATSSLPTGPAHPPAAPMVSGHVPDPASGTAVWHEPGRKPENLLGLAYPALDPETSCEHAGPGPSACSGDLNPGRGVRGGSARTGPGCVRLPYLSVGSQVRMRNDCAERTRIVPVTSCGGDRPAVLRPLRHVRDLAQRPDRGPHHAAFVELGGALEVGCFNATMTIGG